MLATWVALQFLRSSSTRRPGEDIYRSCTKLEVGTFTTKQVRERLGIAVGVPEAGVEATRVQMLA
jgi:hypothetical protein